MKKIYLYKRRTHYPGLNTQFTHFWNNDSENVYDFKTQYTNEDDTQSIVTHDTFDSLLDYYHPDYIWEDVSDFMSIENPTFGSMVLVGNTVPLDVDGDIFVKIIDDNGNIIYYYNSGITETTSQNNKVTNYRISLTLDKWASYRYKFHQYMTKLSVDLLFNQKHNDRFIWNKDESRGYYLDYNIQTYLNVNLVNLQRPLIKSVNDTFLSLEELLYINSYSPLQYADWYNKIYLSWTQAPFATYFAPNNETPTLESILDENCFKGRYYAELAPFRDIDYNSNGLYKWLALKTGDNVNTTSSGEKEGSVFNNKKISLARKLPKTDTSATVVTVNNGEEFISANEEINGTKNGESWSFEIVKSFPMENSWTAESLQDNPITLSLSGNTLLNESRGDFKVWAYRPSTQEEVDLYVADTQTHADLLQAIIGIIFMVAYFLEIKQHKLLPYFLTTKQRAEYSNRDALLNAQVITIENVQSDTWYTLIDRAFWYQWSNNATPHWNMHEKIEIRFNSSTDEVEFRFVMTGGDLTLNNSSDELKLRALIGWTFTGLNITCNAERTEIDNDLELTGEEMCLIPVLKSDVNLPLKVTDASLSKTIYYLHNSNGITLGSQSVIGSLINDIPPLLWAIASRKNKINNKFTLSFTNLISTDRIQKAGEENERFSPFDIHSLALSKKSGAGGHIDYYMPVMFTDFSYVPITIARSPIKNDNMFDANNCLGGNYFLNHYYQLLTDYDLTHQNTMDAEPAMFNPLIYRWVFNIDGFHNIAVTPDMLNLNALLEDWEVNLNTVISSATYYKLDLGNLKSHLYKFTEQFSELSSFDGRNYPYSTSQYYNWLQNNQASYQTSKALLDRSLDYNMLSGAMNMFIEPIQGALEGAKYGKVGVGVGAAAGAIGGAGSLVNTILQNQKAQKDFATQWDGKLTNMYRSPVSLNVSGFGDGSLNFSSWSESGNYSCNFFRTYVLPEYITEKIWYLVALKGTPTYGIPYKYADYDNRRVFNYFELDTHTRHADLVECIRSQAKNELPLFNSPQFIEDFLSYISAGIRVWKRKYNKTQMEQYILENIENEYQPPFNPELPDAIIPLNIENNLTSTYSVTPENEGSSVNPLPSGLIEDFLHAPRYYQVNGDDVWMVIPTTVKLINIPYTDIFPETHTKQDFKEICDKINFDFKGTDFLLEGNKAQGGQIFNYNFKNNTSLNEIKINENDTYSLTDSLIIYNNLENNASELDIEKNDYLNAYLYYNPQNLNDAKLKRYTTQFKIEDLIDSNFHQGCLIWNKDSNMAQISKYNYSSEYPVEYSYAAFPDLHAFVYQRLDNQAICWFQNGEQRVEGDYHCMPATDFTTNVVPQTQYDGLQTIEFKFSDFDCNTFEEFANKVTSIHLPESTDGDAHISQCISIFWSWPLNTRYHTRGGENYSLSDIFNGWEWNKTASGSVTAVSNVCFYQPDNTANQRIVDDFEMLVRLSGWVYNKDIALNPVLTTDDEGYNWADGCDPFTCRMILSDNSIFKCGKWRTVLFNKVILSWKLSPNEDGIIFTLDSKPYVGGWIASSEGDIENIKALSFGDSMGVDAYGTLKFGYNRWVNNTYDQPDTNLNNNESKNILFNLSVDYIPTVLKADETNIMIKYQTNITLQDDHLNLRIIQQNWVKLIIEGLAEFAREGFFDINDWDIYLASKITAPNTELTENNYQNKLTIKTLFNNLNFFKK